MSAAKPAGSFAKGVMPRACGGVMSSGRQRPDLRDVGPKPCGRPPNGTNGVTMRCLTLSLALTLALAQVLALTQP